MRIYHETLPAIAIHIARTKQFICGEIAGDAGLNCYIEGSLPNLSVYSQAEKKGALITFEWTGPISSDGYWMFGDPDTLYDQRPHRGFVPVDTTQHLKLVGIELLYGQTFADLVHRPNLPSGTDVLKPWIWWEWAQSRRSAWVKAQAQQLESTIAALVAERPSISVVPPRRAPYLGYLQDWRATRMARTGASAE
ncbi:hypothetical protein [Ralstonia sp. ASV6]|uniref:hypothetical protein n=1 Tax=Ralstonia sp. ASV6 TaxID=2795124 RepID=UPI0018ED203B|nr:hypothetical protein [Ralstonia sp. ASV6]